MATIIPFPIRSRTEMLCDWQLEALREGLKLLGPQHAQRFPRLTTALANGVTSEESGPLNGTASRNTLVTAASSCA